MSKIRHKLLRISSEDRDIGISKSTSEFTITLNNSDGMQGIKSIIVKQISIPNVMYNINTYNNTLTYEIGGTPTSFTIPIGQYTYAEFETAIEAAGVGIGLTLTLNTITNRILLGTTTAVEWLDIRENPMAEVLGITIDGGSGSDVNAFTPSGIIALSGTENVYLESTKLSTSNMISSDKTIRHILATVPITVPYGAVEHYISQHTDIDDFDMASVRHGDNIQKFDIELVDKHNRTIDLLGHHVVIILKVYY